MPSENLAKLPRRSYSIAGFAEKRLYHGIGETTAVGWLFSIANSIGGERRNDCALWVVDVC